MPSKSKKSRTINSHHRNNSSNPSFGNTTPFPPPAPLPIDSFDSPPGFSSSNSFNLHDNDGGGTGSLEYPQPYGHTNSIQTQNEKVASFSKSVRFSHAVQTSIPIPDRTHGSLKKTAAAMQSMDPFEVRIRFTQHLQHLNASVTSANKAAQYALKYRDMDEDLHSCILEQLEKVNTHHFQANEMKLIILGLVEFNE